MKQSKIFAWGLALVMLLGLTPVTLAAGTEYEIKEIISAETYDDYYYIGASYGLLCAQKDTPGGGFEEHWLDQTGAEQKRPQYNSANDAGKLYLSQEDNYHLSYENSEGNTVITVKAEENDSGYKPPISGTWTMDGHALIMIHTMYENNGQNPMLYFVIDDTKADYAVQYKAASSGSLTWDEYYVYKTDPAEGTSHALIHKFERLKNTIYEAKDSFSDGLIVVSDQSTDWDSETNQSERLYGYMDTAGTMVIPSQYYEANSFEDGVAWVKVNKEDKEYRLIGKTGKELMTLVCDELQSWKGGYCRIRRGDKNSVVAVVKKDAAPAPVTFVMPKNDAEARERIEALQKQYPEGLHWTNDDMYHSEALSMYGNGCTGFALLCSDAAFGDAPARYHSDFDQIRAGDVLWVNNNTHSVIVLEKRSDGVTVAEGNYNSSIHWGRKISRTELENGAPSNPFSDWPNWVMTRWPEEAPAKMATENLQTVKVDGKDVSFAMYSPDNGGTNYVRLVDLAVALKDTAGQFNVSYDGRVLLTSRTPYTGAASTAPFHNEMVYTMLDEPTYVDGVAKSLEAIRFEYQNGGYTYYKLRDLGEALGFNVGWTAQQGIFIESDKPYTDKN